MKKQRKPKTKSQSLHREEDISELTAEELRSAQAFAKKFDAEFFADVKALSKEERGQKLKAVVKKILERETPQ